MQEKKMEKYAEQTKQEFEGWDEFISKPVDEKLEAFKQNGRIGRHDSVACQNQSGTEQTQAPFAPQTGHALFRSAINANVFVLSKCLSHFGADHFGNSGHLHQF
jgi:hypothetical protein